MKGYFWTQSDNKYLRIYTLYEKIPITHGQKLKKKETKEEGDQWMDYSCTLALHFNVCGFKLHAAWLNGGNQIINSQRSMPCSILEQSLNIQRKMFRKK
jgi:hypothetical protein